MFDIGKQRLTAETRKGLPGDFVRLSAGVTHYELRGEPNGRPVVLIHGNAAPLATWDNTIEDLCAAGFRVLRYDLFGHGFSDRPKRRRYDRGLYDTQLAELVSALGILSPILVVGSSQGGSIAACFASEHPGKVAKLALVAPFFDTFEGSRSAAALLLRTPVIGELVVHLVGDRALTDLSDAMALPADGRAALEHQVGEQLRFRGREERSWRT